MINPEIEQVNNVYFKALVPREGKCDTIEGELLRAINRIIYRYYNDGDHLSDDPVKSAHAYLSKCNVIYVPKDTTGKKYEAELEKSLTSVLVYIINRGGKYRRNEIDMMDYRTKG